MVEKDTAARVGLLSGLRGGSRPTLFKENRGLALLHMLLCFYLINEAAIQIISRSLIKCFL